MTALPELTAYPEPSVLAHALEASGESVEIDNLDGRVLFVNDAWCRLFSRDRRQAIGTRWDDLLLSGSDNEELKASWRRCIAEGHSEGAFKVRRIHGAPATILYARSLYQAPEGAPTAAITVYRPLKPTLTAFEVFPLWNAVLERSRDGIAVLDAGGFLVSANGAFVELTGYERDKMPGLDFRSLLAGSQQVPWSADEGRREWSAKLRLSEKNGAGTPETVSITPVKDDEGEAVGFVVRAAAASGPASVAHASQNRRCAHELRNVFTAIVSNVTLLDRYVNDRNLRRHLTLIQRAIKSGIDILDNMRSDDRQT